MEYSPTFQYHPQPTAFTSQVVHNCHTQCARLGCQYQEGIRLLGVAQEVLNTAKKMEGKQMASEWCESTTDSADGHPFNGKHGKVIVNREIHWPNGNVDRDDPITYCMRHGTTMGLVPKDDIADGEVIAEIGSPHD